MISTIVPAPMPSPTPSAASPSPNEIRRSTRIPKAIIRLDPTQTTMGGKSYDASLITEEDTDTETAYMSLMKAMKTDFEKASKGTRKELQQFIDRDTFTAIHEDQIKFDPILNAHATVFREEQ